MLLGVLVIPDGTGVRMRGRGRGASPRSADRWFKEGGVWILGGLRGDRSRHGWISKSKNRVGEPMVREMKNGKEIWRRWKE